MVIGRFFRLLVDWLPGPFGCSFWPVPRRGHKVHTHWLHFKFKAVRDAFDAHFVTGIERAAELCIYYKGRMVVDAHGVQSNAEEHAWTAFGADCVMVTFSVSKAVSATIISMLVARGRLKLDSPVRDYWAEFPVDILVRDLLTHNAGLCWFSATCPLDELTDVSAATKHISALIEAEVGRVFPPTGRAYHTITWGLLVSELVRRVDESGRSIGELLDEWLSKPLGSQMTMGAASITDNVQRRLIRHHRVPFLYRTLCVHLPALFGADWGAFVRRVIYNMASPWNRSFNSVTTPWLTAPALNLKPFQRFELAGSNMVASARALGRLAGALACGGKIDGQVIAEPAAMAALLERVTDGSMPYADPVLFGTQLEWTACGLGVFEMGDEMGGTWYGWQGLGGSVMYFNPSLELAYVYLTSGLRDDITREVRHVPLMKAAVEAARSR